jgi:hypothetical protein
MHSMLYMYCTHACSTTSDRIVNYGGTCRCTQINNRCRLHQAPKLRSNHSKPHRFYMYLHVSVDPITSRTCGHPALHMQNNEVIPSPRIHPNRHALVLPSIVKSQPSPPILHAHNFAFTVEPASTSAYISSIAVLYIFAV